MKGCPRSGDAPVAAAATHLPARWRPLHLPGGGGDPDPDVGRGGITRQGPAEAHLAPAR